MEIEGTKELFKNATKFYKDIFGHALGNIIHMNFDTWKECEKLSEQDNVELVKEFYKRETKETMFSMEANRAPGPDNIPVEFYKVVGRLLKMI